jgi:hypothetical protein
MTEDGVLVSDVVQLAASPSPAAAPLVRDRELREERKQGSAWASEVKRRRLLSRRGGLHELVSR